MVGYRKIRAFESIIQHLRPQFCQSLSKPKAMKLASMAEAPPNLSKNWHTPHHFINPHGISSCCFYKNSVPKIANIGFLSYLCSEMIVTFVHPYLQELYVTGKTSDKKHRIQPQTVTKYVKVVNIMKQVENVLGLVKYGSLHYEKLHGDKEGITSARVNDQCRIEFTEGMENGKHIATICNIIELK